MRMVFVNICDFEIYIFYYLIRVYVCEKIKKKICFLSSSL